MDMKHKKRKHSLVTVIMICICLVCSMTQLAFGADLGKGQSLVAADQEKAAKGLNYPGLDITWLDFGDDHVGSFSSNTQYRDGIFTINMVSAGVVAFDTSGKIISSGHYNHMGSLSDGLALVTQYVGNAEGGPPPSIFGYIDKDGNEVIPLGTFQGYGSDFHEGFAYVGADKVGFINTSGAIAIPQIYREAREFSEGLAPVQSADTGLWGYVDTAGELAIPMEYQVAKPFHEDLAYVCKNNRAGYIDKAGNVAIDLKFRPSYDSPTENTEWYRDFCNGLAAARDESGNYGYIDKTGEFVIPARYREAEPFFGEVALVSTGTCWLINKQGEMVTPVNAYTFYSGEEMKDELYRVSVSNPNGSWESFVMLNQYGAEVIPSSLGIEYLSPFNDGYALLMSLETGAIGLVKKPSNIDDQKSGKLIKVSLNGKRLDFYDSNPVIENARALVPMRVIFEALGARVTWDAASETVNAVKEGTTVSLKIGDSKAYLNGEKVSLDASPKIVNQRTLVPIRFIAESFNADVIWDDATRTVSITAK